MVSCLLFEPEPLSVPPQPATTSPAARHAPTTSHPAARVDRAEPNLLIPTLPCVVRLPCRCLSLRAGRSEHGADLLGWALCAAAACDHEDREREHVRRHVQQERRDVDPARLQLELQSERATEDE